ncbi:hypothetical protein IE53DRAFT_383178 [Violaceomyces palustris]|uniref:Uncharacterized protein n=1 Tax=Violaceomyces palustris TaxID=1673888 RepID=A0ACD0P892_9BASI|nr:hypothetical protein IE53DRAFT_383178 [Violaceomyces palustris]
MATVEKPRPSSVKALARTIPALSHPAPPSPPLILRNPDVIILPSVPTHEPEDDLPLTHDLGLSFASSSRLEPDRAEDGEEEEEEEVLEELRDESDDVQDRTWIRSDLGASLAAVQSTAIVALESLVQTFTPSSERGEVEVQRILLDLQDCVRQLSSRLCGSQPGSPKPYSAQLEASQRSLPGSAHKWGEGLNDELFVRLDSLLGQLTQSQDPVVASRDDLQLANALGALAASCEGLRDNSLDLAVALREEPYPFQRPGSSASLLSNNRRSSLNTARSTPSEELRDPFAEIQEPDVFATLSRMMTSLSSRAVPNTPPPPSPHSPPLEATAAFNPTLSSLAHQGNLSKRSSLTEETQPFSGEANHAEERLLPTGNMTAWAQVAELLSITKELVASRRAAVTPARPYNDAPLSPRARSRRGSSIGHGQEHFETVHEAAQKRHSVGSNRSAPMIAAASSTFIDAKSLRRQKSGSSLGAISLPPRYSDDEFRNSPTAAHLAGFAVHNSWQTRKRQSSSLPEYSDENGRGLDFCSQAEKKDSPRDEVASSGSASASSSSVYAARSPQDLFLVQASIERLYTAVPQLDDQRAALSPSKLRDVNLQELMDRINRSGRMEDQRAAPPTLRNKVAASPTSARPSASRSSSPVLRTFSASSVTKRFSVSNLAATFRRVSQPEVEGKGKARELEKEDHPDPRSLGPLIDSMHKAQDLSMADQRVELKPRRKKQHKVLALAGHDVSSGKGAARDDEELLGILSANSRSRMTNQDFVRKPVSSARTIGNNYYGLPGHLSEEPLTTRRRAGSAPFVSSAMSIDTSGSFDPEVPFSSLIERQDVAYRQGDFGRPWESVSGQTASGLSPNSSEARSAAGSRASPSTSHI